MFKFKYLILFICLISFMLQGQMVNNRNQTTIDQHANDWVVDTLDLSVLPNYGSEESTLIGDSLATYYYINAPDGAIDYYAGYTGYTQLFLNEAYNAEGYSGCYFEDYIIFKRSVSNQYRNGCCYYSAIGGYNCSTWNICTYNWIVLNGGANDFLKSECTEVGLESCSDDAECEAILDKLLVYDSEGDPKWSGQSYDFIVDVSLQESGDKKILYIGMEGLSTFTSYVGNDITMHEQCIRELGELWEQMAADTALETALGIELYYIDLRDIFNETLHMEYYLRRGNDEDSLHFSYLGGEAIGSYVADFILDNSD